MVPADPRAGFRRKVLGRPDGRLARAQSRHRLVHAEARCGRQLARAAGVPDQRRQRLQPLRVQHQLQRLARDAVVHVRRHGAARRAYTFCASTSMSASTSSTAASAIARVCGSICSAAIFFLLPDVHSARLFHLAVVPGRPGYGTRVSNNAGGLMRWPVKLLLPVGFGIARAAGHFPRSSRGRRPCAAGPQLEYRYETPLQ